MNHIISLIHLTRTNEPEVIRQVTALPCSYEYAASFYATFGRYPTAEECRFIHLDLIGAYSQILRDDGTKNKTLNGASQLPAIDLKTLTNKKAL